jgi:lipopolysaccharide export system protein LptC
MAGPGLYSRVVAVLKVGLPLIAAAMLAGLFLISDDGRQGGELVFSPADLAALGAGMRVTRPVFSGVTEGMDRFRFTAEEVTPDAAPPTRATITALSGHIDFADGRGVDLRADGGAIDLEDQRLTLEGAVQAATADGYAFTADRVEIDLRGGGLVATGRVAGDGPMGRIDAARLTVADGEGPAETRRFLFERDVRLVYHPAAGPGPGTE